MLGLLIYALRPKEVLVHAKPKLFPMIWRRCVRALLAGFCKAASLTGWTQRAPYIFGKLFLERAWHDWRWRPGASN